MIVAVVLAACSKTPAGAESGVESGVMDTPTESAAKSSECASPAESAQALEAELVGSWAGPVYAAYHTAEVTMRFGADGSFSYSHPEDPFGDGPFVVGDTFDVLSPSLILTHGETYGGDATQRGLRSVYLTEDCVLSFNTEGYTLFQDGMESSFVLTKQE